MTNIALEYNALPSDNQQQTTATAIVLKQTLAQCQLSTGIPTGQTKDQRKPTQLLTEISNTYNSK